MLLLSSVLDVKEVLLFAFYRIKFNINTEPVCSTVYVGGGSSIIALLGTVN